MTLQLDAEESLRSLGRTPYAVYRTLKAKGLTGKPGSNNTCPVARFIKSEGVPEAVKVEVLYSFALIQMEEVPRPSGKRPVPEEWKTYQRKLGEATAILVLPDAVADFIDRFDGGKYPSLEAAS